MYSFLCSRLSLSYVNVLWRSYQKVNKYDNVRLPNNFWFFTIILTLSLIFISGKPKWHKPESTYNTIVDQGYCGVTDDFSGPTVYTADDK